MALRTCAGLLQRMRPTATGMTAASVSAQQVREKSKRRLPTPYADFLTPPTTLKHIPFTKEETVINEVGSISKGALGAKVYINDDTGAKVPHKRSAAPSMTPPMFLYLDADVADKFVETSKDLLRVKELARRPKDVHLPESKVLGKDENAANRRFDMVFVDKSNGPADVTRPILVREKDGTLRTATPEEAIKFSHMVFPGEGKRVRLPKIFDKDKLPLALEENLHDHLLDLLTKVQYPYHASFNELHGLIFEDIDKRRIYSIIQDTQHWHKFVKFLVANKQINGLLESLLEKRRVQDAAALVDLYSDATAVRTAEQQARLLEEYVTRANSKVLLEKYTSAKKIDKAHAASAQPAQQQQQQQQQQQAKPSPSI